MTATDDEVLAVFRYFDSSSIKGEQNLLISLMKPQDFLRVAAPVPARVDSSERLAASAALRDAGTPYSTLPKLWVTVDGGTIYVSMHDGRHRSKALIDAGCELIPVLIIDDRHEVVVSPEFYEEVREAITIFPQPHDEDEHYPGLSAQLLDERLDPIESSAITRRLMLSSEILNSLSRTPSFPGP